MAHTIEVMGAEVLTLYDDVICGVEALALSTQIL